MHRRRFLRKTMLAAAGFGGASLLVPDRSVRAAAPAPAPGESSEPAGRRAPLPFEISLAQWSLHKTLFARKLSNLDFPRYARRELGIDAVEFVDQFFSDRSGDAAYIEDLRKRCQGEGVRPCLIMVDTAGALGDADGAGRARAVENHKRWLDAAKALGCHSLRVNAGGPGGADELRKRIAESGSQLAEHGAQLDVNVIVENHGGLSSDPEWLVSVCREVGSPWFGTLPDFGNFSAGTDRYGAVEKLLPHAKAVSAKCYRFDADGNETAIDFPRMMRIVLDSGYRGFVGIECEGARNDEEEPGLIRQARALLERIRSAEHAARPLFNGRDFSGWVKVAGGDWSVEEDALVARNGQGWSTDPSRTGSWLRTEREHGDFDLSLEYSVEPRTNSGVFIRASLERNPAFTGYEVQIHDSPGSPPRKGGPGSLYDVVAPTKNRVKPAGEWNHVRVVARGPWIRVHINGEMVIDYRGDRSLRGYIGLQNHDERSVARFRNIWIAE